MASIIESIQNDMQNTQLDYLRILAILFKAYRDNHTSQINANRALATLNHLSNQLDKAIKAAENGEPFESPVDISKYRGDMQKEVLKALDNYGIKYTVFPTSVISKNGTPEIANFLVTEATPRARAALETIRNGLDETISNATKIVMLDMNTFAQQNSNRRCVMYDNLNEQQVNEFKEMARQNNFTFGITNKDGKYAIAVTADVATRYRLDQFAYECSVFNKSGLLNAMLDLEAINRDKMRSKAMENLTQPSSDKTYYVDLCNPAHYVEVSGNTLTVHTAHEPAKSYNAQTHDLRDVLEMEFENVKENLSQMVAITHQEFMDKYKTTPLDVDALLKFTSDEVNLSRYKRHAVMIEQIKGMAEKISDFQPQNSILKNLKMQASTLPQNSPQRKEVEEFIARFASSTPVKQQELLQDKKPALMTKVEFDMLKKANAGNLTPTEFVYGTIMANAEKIATKNGNNQVLSLIANNSFNIDKITQMIKTQDAVGSNFVTSENFNLANDFTQVFKNAVIVTSQEELNSNATYLANIRDAMVTVKASEVLLNISNQADRKGMPELKSLCTNPSKQEALINCIKKVMNGESLEQSGLLSETNLSEKQLTPLVETALDNTSETPNISIAQLSRMSFFSTLSTTSPLSDIVEKATIQDMEVAEKDASYRTETTGDLIAESNNGDFSLDDMNIDTIADIPTVGELDNYEL